MAATRHHAPVTAFAPACVGNVAVGFDLLGHAIVGPGDRVSAQLAEQPGVRIRRIRGTTARLPTDPETNTAGKAAMSLLAAHAPELGIDLSIDKGIPLASGLAGSAASAVAAVVAVNALLPEPLERSALYPHALAGESVASGADCGDNVGPQLLGGLVLAACRNLIRIPVPEGLTAVVVCPEMTIQTRSTRRALEAPFALADITTAQANLARVLAGCYTSDLDLIRAGLSDVLIEPRRAGLIPGLAAVKQAALEHNALGTSISGSGPSVFAWFEDEPAAATAAPAMTEAFRQAGLRSEPFISPVDAPGACLLGRE